VLGDLVIDASGFPKSMAIRVLIDSSGTTFASVMAAKLVGATTRLLANRPPMHTFSFASHSREETWATSRERGAAGPPFTHGQTVAAKLGVTEVAELHRKLVSSVQAELLPFTSIDQMADELRRKHEMTRAWRAAQPADALLDADLRALLGQHYDRLGDIMKKRLARALPKAVARK
jgi:hypothetical protein